MDPLYLHYDRSALDAQYNVRAVVPEATDIMARGTRWSERTRAQRSAMIDVAFGASDGERLNVFPSNDANAPVVVFIHGGYWQRLDKSDFDFVADGLVPNGCHVVSLNYDLAPRVDVAEIIRQVRAGVVWVWRNAATFGGDATRIHVAGHSAGGHLCAMLALTRWPQIARDLPADLVKSACAISGLYDLEPIRLSVINEPLGLDAKQAQALSPINCLEPPLPPLPQGLTLCVGASETDEFHRQQREFAHVAREHGVSVEEIVLPSHNHFTVVMELGEPEGILASAIKRQTKV